jgi:membrane-associated phospholipid phosphatase
MQISQIIRELRFYLIPTLLFGLVSLYFTAYYGLAQTQLWFNAFYSQALDSIMPFYTYLGDGLIFVFLIFPLLFFKRRAIVSLAFTAILTLVVIASLKAYFNEPRPLKYFETQVETLREVPGVKPHYKHSFPSGHTTAAFGAWAILAFYSRKKYLQLIFFSVALGVAYSRVYLSMHFLRDVGAGAILGSFIAITALYLSAKMNKPWLNSKWWP